MRQKRDAHNKTRFYWVKKKEQRMNFYLQRAQTTSATSVGGTFALVSAPSCAARLSVLPAFVSTSCLATASAVRMAASPRWQMAAKLHSNAQPMMSVSLATLPTRRRNRTTIMFSGTRNLGVAW